jgi:hypothetical protein
MEAFDGYYRPVHVKQLVMTAVRLLRGGVQRLGRGTADRTWTTSTAIAPLRMAFIDHTSVAVVKCAA